MGSLDVSGGSTGIHVDYVVACVPVRGGDSSRPAFGGDDLRNLESGASLDEILQWYDGLDRQQVKAVIDFAVRSLHPSAASR